MNSKWKIKEAGTQSHHRIPFFKKRKKKDEKSMKAGTTERKLAHLQPNFTLRPTALPMESDRHR